MKTIILILFLMLCFSLKLYSGSQDTISYGDTVWQTTYEELLKEDSTYYSSNPFKIFNKINIGIIYDPNEYYNKDYVTIYSNTVWNKVVEINPSLKYQRVLNIEDIEYDKLFKKIEESDFKDPVFDSTKTRKLHLSITTWDGKFKKTYRYNLPEKYELLKEMFCCIKHERIDFCEMMTRLLSHYFKD